MDDFAHLLVGYAIWRIARLAGIETAGYASLAAALLGSVIPDILWPWGVLSYAATHTLTYYIVLAIPFLIYKKSRVAAALFLMAVAAHVIIDMPMHEATYTPLAPVINWQVSGTFNYWTSASFMIGYWIAVLALVGATFLYEWKLTGRATLGCNAGKKAEA